MHTPVYADSHEPPHSTLEVSEVSPFKFLAMPEHLQAYRSVVGIAQPPSGSQAEPSSPTVWSRTTRQPFAHRC